MILVDSSVWIDILANRSNPHTERFELLLAEEQFVGVADLVMTEVLQGTRSARDFDRARETLESFPLIRIADSRISVTAARNYRQLRERGITIRKTIDTLIATRCIEEGFPLLYRDRDYDHFVQHLGLRSALDHAGAS